MLKQTLLMTRLSRGPREYIATSLWEDGRILELDCQETDKNHILGNIYVGRVRDIVKNLNAAFIEIEPGNPCYYSMEDFEKAVFIKKINSPSLVQGDEILVQVVRESMKTKPPQVTTNLNFTGKYLALTTGNTKLGISKKLRTDRRTQLKNLLTPEKEERFGIIARTNSNKASDEEILKELRRLQRHAGTIMDTAKYRTCFSCLMEQRPEYLNHIQNVRTEYLEKILTDDGQIFKQMKDFMQEFQPEDEKLLTLYEDTFPLQKLYSLEKELEDALKERVWLKSGAYLVIQPTEALTVIDVNSGKSMANKQAQDHYLKVNLEAADEAARQLRLRNISGIVIIDFIDMKAAADKNTLMEALRRHLARDPVPAQLVDMTKLNLVEITRKKVRRSLMEEMNG